MRKIIIICLLLFPLITSAKEVNLLTEAVKFTGEFAGDQVGQNIAPAGDVNGDGYSDFLISANNAVDLFYGQSETLTDQSLSQAQVKFTAEVSGDHAGDSISSAGDVNGDGYSDFLIGAPQHDTDGQNNGAVYLFYGSNSLSGTINLSQADVKITGEEAGDIAGTAVSSLGDLNKDGYADILIGAPGADTAGNQSGTVYIVYGGNSLNSSIDLSEAQVSFFGEIGGDRAGTVVSYGDVNGDDYSDILISNTTDTRTIYLIYGSNSLININLAQADVKFTGEASGDSAGQALVIGDTDGDGYDDILIGAPYYNNGTTYLIHGQPEALATNIGLAHADAMFISEETNSDAGTSVATLDINADNYQDILIGADAVWYDPGTGTVVVGAAYLIYGKGSGFAGEINLSEADIKLEGGVYGDQVGAAVSSAGDVNGDGFEEILVGAPGEGTAGAVYLSYIYNNLEKQDGIDNDGDGQIDEPNTLDENGPHPRYGDYDPADTSLHDLAISLVEGAKRGNIKVTYTDNLVYRYKIFNISLKKKTKVKHYRKTGYYLILHPQGKKVALVNIFNGQTLKRKKLSPKKKHQYNSLKVFKLRKKYWAVITSKKKNNKTRLAVVRIKIKQEKFGKKITKKFKNKKIKVKKTKKKKNKVRLRNKKGKNIQKYLMTKKYKLKLIK